MCFYRCVVAAGTGWVNRIVLLSSDRLLLLLVIDICNECLCLGFSCTERL